MSKKVLGIGAALLVFAVLVPSLNADVLLNQNFNGSWGPWANNPPSGWTIIYTGGYDRSDWNNGNWGYSAGTSGGVPQMDYMGPDPFTYQTDDFISPTVNCAGYPAVWIAFRHEYSYYGGGYTGQTLGSINNGSTWPNVIWDYMNSSYARRRDSVDVSSWAANQTQVKFNFHGYGPPWNINYRNFDDVIVYGFTGGGPDRIDLELAQIIRPKDVEDAGVAFRTKCKVYNNTDDTVVAELACRIKLLAGATVYEDVLASVPFAPGYTDVELKFFTAEGGKTYTAFFVVTHPDDINPSNNYKEKRFGTAGAVVDATEILSPLDDQYNEFDPRATFTEMIGMDAPTTWLHCTIDGPLFAIVYHDSVQHDFAANDVYTQPFAPVTTLENGDYTVTFWAANSHGDPIGDKMSKPFTYTGVAEKPVASSFGLEVVGTKVNFSLAKASNVTISLYDVSGNLVSVLVSGSREAGEHSVTLNTEKLSTGIYFVKMLAPGFSAVRKATVLY